MQSFLALIGEIGSLGQAHYNLFFAMWVVACRMPGYIYALFPIAGLIGSIVGLGRLAASNELLVMQAAGFSVAQITRAVVLGAFCVMLLMTFLGEVVAPHLNQTSNQIRNRALERVASSAVESVWLHRGSNFLYVQSMPNAHRGSNASYFAYAADGRLKKIFSAPHIQRIRPGYWRWYHSQVTQFRPQHVASFKPSKYVMPMHLNTSMITASHKDSQYLNLLALREQISGMQHVGLSTNNLRFEFWRRVFQPLVTLVMICLGVPFVFGALRDVAAGSRVMLGVGIGFLFYVLNQIIGPVGMVLQLSPLLAALLPGMLFYAAYYCLQRRSA